MSCDWESWRPGHDACEDNRPMIPYHLPLYCARTLRLDVTGACPRRVPMLMLLVVFSLLAMTTSGRALQVQGNSSPLAATTRATADEGTADATTPQEPVITIVGSCEAGPAEGSAPCNTVITRSEFEELTTAMDPTMSAQAKYQFANSYARFLMLAREAHRQGLEKDPRFQKLLELTRIQLLGQMLLQQIQQRAQEVTPAEVDKFFRENPKPYEIATVLRIYVPGTKLLEQGNNPPALPSEKDATMRAAAEDLRARAAAGEDFASLQKEAFQLANMKAPPPDIKLGKISRDRLAQDQQSVFDLKPGDVSPAFESADGYYIFKLVDKEIPPLDAVKDQASKNLQSQRMESSMAVVTGSTKVVLNKKYFGQAAASAKPETR